jgi:pyruvate/2-oxoglutarate dehydrogenase complex dihydrolipoamide dehydrogenase (E3) component
MGDTILPRDDRELTRMLAGQLEEEDLKIMTGTTAVTASQLAKGIVLTVEDARKQKQDLRAEAVLVAVGRKPNVEGLDLEKAGVEYGPKGVRPQTAHHRAEHLCLRRCGGAYQFSHRPIPAVPVERVPARQTRSTTTWSPGAFTDPELAHAGQPRKKKRHGDKVSVYRYPYGSTDRARTDNTEFGMAKYICGPGGRLLGAHILGARAGDIIHEAQLVRYLNLPFSAVANMIHIYPTYTDVVRQPAKLYYVDRIRNNPFVKFIQKIMAKKK